jgi:ABC-3C protein
MSDVTQKHNLVGGDQAGGDIDKSQRSYTFQKTQESISYMSRLLKKFEHERANNITLNGYVEQLEHYHSRLEGDVLGLEQKLKDGNAEDFIDFALKAKESFYKRLTKYQLYESAQEINVHLLALVISYFELQIAPRIRAGCDAQELGVLINQFILQPLLEQLEENTLGFTAVDINGMLFFLTGNCHLTWKK